jgi:gas vesicle structural protein
VQPRSLAGVLPDDELTALELVDRLLNRGVVLVGEATISVAGVDLIYLGLNVVLSSVESLEKRRPGESGAVGPPSDVPGVTRSAPSA